MALYYKPTTTNRLVPHFFIFVVKFLYPIDINIIILIFVVHYTFVLSL